MFTNRSSAGKLLAYRLLQYKGKHVVVLALPRGGVPVAFEVAKALKAPLALSLVRKLTHPINRELAIGAASLDDYLVRDHEAVSEEYINEEIARVRHRLYEMRNLFTKGREHLSLQGQIVILIDDGIATGASMQCAVMLIKKQHPLKLVVAVPVASSHAMEMLEGLADEVVALEVKEDFGGVGDFFENFEQLTDEEVLDLLNGYPPDALL